MRVLGELGGETWFRLGDGDLALHVERTRRLASGTSLSAIMDDVRQRLGIATRLLPMTDDPVRTRVRTPDAELDFQEYFVRLRAEPAVRAITFVGAAEARLAPAIGEALGSAHLRAIVLCPSNPYLSIDPMLAVPGLAQALRARRVPAVAVSPLIGGRAVKGPTAKIMRELGIDATNRSIAAHYAGLIDGLVVDEADRSDEALPGIAMHVARTLMQTLDDRETLARGTLEFADRLRRGGERAG
jgi:LPPG:FO 2-phospho-L-lactate transferase